MVFVKQGNHYSLRDPTTMQQLEKLPAGNYVIKREPMGGPFYLDKVDDFIYPSKIYGSVMSAAKRILSTYLDRSASTGVLLSGEKGSGKTLTAKMTILLAKERNIPCLLSNTPWCGDEFNQFCQNITQECVIFFDEFEKVYDPAQQQQLLTLLDGTFPQKKLFLITCNDKYRIDSHMENRPGRIYYSLDYQSLETEFITEYCNDLLIDKSQTPNMVRVASLFNKFNFDMLKAMVEEVNRYGETPLQAIKFLNAKPETAGSESFSVNLKIDGEKPAGIVDPTVYLNPLRSQEFDIDVRPSDPDTKGDQEDESFTFSVGDLKGINGNTGEYTYEKMCRGRRIHLVLSRQKVQAFDLQRHATLFDNGYDGTAHGVL